IWVPSEMKVWTVAMFLDMVSSLQVLFGVYGFAFDQDLVMQVRAEAVAGVSHRADRDAFFHMVPSLHEGPGQMGIKRLHAMIMIDFHEASQVPVLARLDHDPRRRRRYQGIAFGDDIDAIVA